MLTAPWRALCTRRVVDRRAMGAIAPPPRRPPRFTRYRRDGPHSPGLWSQDSTDLGRCLGAELGHGGRTHPTPEEGAWPPRRGPAPFERVRPRCLGASATTLGDPGGSDLVEHAVHAVRPHVTGCAVVAWPLGRPAPRVTSTEPDDVLDPPAGTCSSAECCWHRCSMCARGAPFREPPARRLEVSVFVNRVRPRRPRQLRPCRWDPQAQVFAAADAIHDALGPQVAVTGTSIALAERGRRSSPRCSSTRSVAPPGDRGRPVRRSAPPRQGGAGTGRGGSIPSRPPRASARRRMFDRPLSATSAAIPCRRRPHTGAVRRRPSARPRPTRPQRAGRRSTAPRSGPRARRAPGRRRPPCAPARRTGAPDGTSKAAPARSTTSTTALCRSASESIEPSAKIVRRMSRMVMSRLVHGGVEPGPGLRVRVREPVARRLETEPHREQALDHQVVQVPRDPVPVLEQRQPLQVAPRSADVQRQRRLLREARRQRRVEERPLGAAALAARRGRPRRPRPPRCAWGRSPSGRAAASPAPGRRWSRGVRAEVLDGDRQVARDDAARERPAQVEPGHLRRIRGNPDTTCTDRCASSGPATTQATSAPASTRARSATTCSAVSSAPGCTSTEVISAVASSQRSRRAASSAAGRSRSRHRPQRPARSRSARPAR